MASGRGHLVRHPAGAQGAEDGKIFAVLVFVIVWLMAMMSLPIWLPALVDSIAG